MPSPLFSAASKVASVFRGLPSAVLGRPRSGSQAERYLLEEKIRASLGYLGSQVRFLPWLDSTVVNETAEMRLTYRQMLREPAVKAAFLSKVLGVAALDLQVHPATDDDADKRIADFVRYSLEHCYGGIRRIALNILAGALMDGFSVSEKVWRIEDRGQWQGKYVLKRLKAKDTQWLDLMGDSYRNVTAIRDQRTGLSFDSDAFVVYAHLPLFEAPMGFSDFRSAYRAFWLMDTAWRLRAIALERYSLPFLKGEYTDPSTRPALENALELVRSQTWITLPKGAQIEAVNLAVKGTSDFEAAIRDLQAEMVLALTGATLQNIPGTVANGRGDSQVHQTTAELLQWYLSAELGDVISDQIVPNCVDLNFAGAAYPRATLSSVNDGTLTSSLTIDQGLQQMGLPLSRKEMYKKYSRQPPPDDKDALGPPPAANGAAPKPAGPALPFAERAALQPPKNGSRSVPDVRQSASGKCGPAALSAALAAFGIQADEATLSRDLGTDAGGTDPLRLIEVARDYGLDADGIENLTLAELADELSEGRLAIVPAQAPGDDPASNDNGHYLVIKAVSPNGVSVQDPSAGPLLLSPQAFQARWHDVAANGIGYDHFAILLGPGEAPAPPLRLETNSASPSPGGSAEPFRFSDAWQTYLNR